MKINKDKKVRMSRWYEVPLSAAQLNYAATDSYVSGQVISKQHTKFHFQASLLLYETLKQKQTELKCQNDN